MIRVESLKKAGRKKMVLNGISFSVAARSVLGIIGKSGCGKTTLMRCMGGLEPFDGGKVAYTGIELLPNLPEPARQKRVKELRKKVGMVFQHLHLFPHLSVLSNIAIAPMNVLKQTRDEAMTTAQKLLDHVGLDSIADQHPDTLSRGEQQFIALLRSLAMKPDILLLDEPTGGLDPQCTTDVRSLLSEFVARDHTLIIVSHSIKFLNGLADELLYMEKGEVIEKNRSEMLLLSPRDPRTQAFLNHA
ncbi:MAG: amino acid ABC transporter ATP-binding protein [Parachlamydiales bacterium]|nr:amino acid ABC transporter ATP-binding protein [Parachlamydiales bacterium]